MVYELQQTKGGQSRHGLFMEEMYHLKLIMTMMSVLDLQYT